MTEKPGHAKKHIIHIPMIPEQGATLFWSCLLILLLIGPFFHYRQIIHNVANDKANSSVQPDISDGHKVTQELPPDSKVHEQNLLKPKQEALASQAKLAATPSIWPTSGDVTSHFGLRNSPWDGDSDWHPGIDIANNTGTPIFATADGTVVRSELSGGYGNLVEIDHGNGILTLYGHNSQIIVQNGQMVKKGQVISYLGSTGNSTGPHVHYEIRENGVAIDPEKFLVLK